MNILIAAGGTGGHLYPAIAVAREILDREWESRILFITTRKGCGVEILKREGFEFRTIAAGGLKKKSPAEMIGSLLKLPIGLVQALFYMASFRPDVVMGAGGYVSGPALAAAWMFGAPRFIHEQNVLPGITNRLAARIARRIAVGFPSARRYFPRSRVHVTGNPVRREFFDLKPRIRKEGPGDVFTLLAFGGSQGAHSINQAMLEAAFLLTRSERPFRVLHQTGKADCQWTKEKYAQMGVNAEVKPFIFDMFDAFRLADLVVCRAGAMTLSELAAAGKPAILIPLQTAADNHQEMNARSLERESAAQVLLDDEFLGKRLSERIHYYMDNPLALVVVGREVGKFARPDAASGIADIAEDLAKNARHC